MSYIVVISQRTNDSSQNLKDRWHHHEDYQSALDDYDSWSSSPETYSISMTAVIQSTDYDPHDVFQFYEF